MNESTSLGGVLTLKLSRRKLRVSKQTNTNEAHYFLIKFRKAQECCSDTVYTLNQKANSQVGPEIISIAIAS